MNKLIRGIKSICMWVGRLVFVNVLWTVGSLIGLLVLGLVPATIGLFAVVRKWVLGERNISILNIFWREYRTNFRKTSLLGIPMIFIGYILLAEINIFWHQGTPLYYALSFLVITTFIVYAFTVIYFFPLYVHYDFTLLQYFKIAAIIGTINPLRTIGLLLLIVFFYIVFLFTPLTFTFLGTSILALIIMHLVYQKFPKINYGEAVK